MTEHDAPDGPTPTAAAAKAFMERVDNPTFREVLENSAMVGGWVGAREAGFRDTRVADSVAKAALNAVLDLIREWAAEAAVESPVVQVDAEDLRAVLLWMPDLAPDAPTPQIERLRAAVMAEADERGRRLHRELAAEPPVAQFPYRHNGCGGIVHFAVNSPSLGHCARCGASTLVRADVHQDGRP